MKCVCKASQFINLQEKKFDDRYGYPENFNLIKCLQCGHIKISKSFKDNDFSKLYGTYYPRRSLTSTDVLNGSRNLKGWKNRIKIYLEGLTNQGQFYSRKGMRVLDYGCGAGYSLVEMTELGIECYGIEADPNVKEIGEKLSLALHVGTLDDFPFKHIKFDLIILNQVLEHIANPEALILELKSLLTHDGSIVISVPNANSIYSKLFKSMWINWHIPYHIHHFNKISLAKLIEICDLKIVKAITVTPNLWTKLQLRSLQYIPILGKKNQMWTDEGVANYRKMTKFEEKLFEFEAKSNFGIRKYIIIIINRMIDMLGQGDSILIRVKK